MKRARDIREDRDMTIREVADYLYCDYSLYSKYEREERPIPVEYLIKLSELFDTNIDYLLGRTDYSPRLPKPKYRLRNSFSN